MRSHTRSMCQSLCGRSVVRPGPSKRATNTHINTGTASQCISRFTHNSYMWPGKTFLDSWPERLEGWPRFSFSHFSLVCSLMLFPTCVCVCVWGYSPLFTLGRSSTHLRFTLIQLRPGKWKHSSKHFLGICDCLLFCRIWVAVKIQVPDVTDPEEDEENTRLCCSLLSSLFSNERRFSQRWKFRQFGWPAIQPMHLFDFCSDFQLFFITAKKQNKTVAGFFFWKMPECRRFKLRTTAMLSYHKFINRHLFWKLTRCVSFKRGECDHNWCVCISLI